jgi:hypothetical protein
MFISESIDHLYLRDLEQVNPRISKEFFEKRLQYVRWHPMYPDRHEVWCLDAFAELLLARFWLKKGPKLHVPVSDNNVDPVVPRKRKQIDYSESKGKG